MTTQMAPTAMSIPSSARPPTWTAPTVNRAVSAWRKPSPTEWTPAYSIRPNPSTRATAQNRSCTSRATGAVGARMASFAS